MPKLTVYTPRKKDQFRRLRGKLLANGLQNADVGLVLNRSAEHISRCLNGKAQWGLAEQYAIMDAIHRPSDNMTIDANKLLRHALRFNPDIICVAEMRGAEAMTAQEAARTGHAVVTSLHANSARKAYGRILSMCRMGGTELSDTTLLRFIIEAFPVMVFKKQISDGTRRIMEIVEATGLDDGVLQANTLFRFDIDTQQHIHAGVISEKLAQRLLDDGVDRTALKRFCSNDFLKKTERRKAI